MDTWGRIVRRWCETGVNSKCITGRFHSINNMKGVESRVFVARVLLQKIEVVVRFYHYYRNAGGRIYGRWLYRCWMKQIYILHSLYCLSLSFKCSQLKTYYFLITLYCSWHVFTMLSSICYSFDLCACFLCNKSECEYKTWFNCKISLY